MTKSVLGIIGGSGLYDLPGLEHKRTEAIKSPWGEPSSEVHLGEIRGLPVAFIPRHGEGHKYSPTTINYRANIDVLRTLAKAVRGDYDPDSIGRMSVEERIAADRGFD